MINLGRLLGRRTVVDVYDWQLIETIEDAADDGLIPPASMVLLWNPCDGHHLVWTLTTRLHAVAEDGRAGVYTHWCLPKPGPAAAPARRAFR